MTSTVNLVLDQGADFAATFNMEAANGAPLDLSAYTGNCQMRRSYASTNAISFNVSLANGDIEISLPSVTTTSIYPGRYMYDVEITSPSNTVTRVIEGIIDVSPNVTR
jgi:hypothetical protein